MRVLAAKIRLPRLPKGPNGGLGGPGGSHRPGGPSGQTAAKIKQPKKKMSATTFLVLVNTRQAPEYPDFVFFYSYW